MSTYTSTEWTCDRCGAETDLGPPGDQPLGWASIYLVTPPLMSPLESEGRPDQVCRRCRDSFDVWRIHVDPEPAP